MFVKGDLMSCVTTLANGIDKWGAGITDCAILRDERVVGESYICSGVIYYRNSFFRSNSLARRKKVRVVTP